MQCNCNSKNMYYGNEATIFEQEYLQEIKVDAHSWKTLYKCKSCNTYWEEAYTNGRFGGTPELKKIDENYIKSFWGSDNIE